MDVDARVRLGQLNDTLLESGYLFRVIDSDDNTFENMGYNIALLNAAPVPAEHGWINDVRGGFEGNFVLAAASEIRVVTLVSGENDTHGAYLPLDILNAVFNGSVRPSYRFVDTVNTAAPALPEVMVLDSISPASQEVSPYIVNKTLQNAISSVMRENSLIDIFVDRIIEKAAPADLADPVAWDGVFGGLLQHQNGSSFAYAGLSFTGLELESAEVKNLRSSLMLLLIQGPMLKFLILLPVRMILLPKLMLEML